MHVIGQMEPNDGEQHLANNKNNSNWKLCTSRTNMNASKKHNGFYNVPMHRAPTIVKLRGALQSTL